MRSLPLLFLHKSMRAAYKRKRKRGERERFYSSHPYCSSSQRKYICEGKLMVASIMKEHLHATRKGIWIEFIIQTWATWYEHDESWPQPLIFPAYWLCLWFNGFWCSKYILPFGMFHVRHVFSSSECHTSITKVLDQNLGNACSPHGMLQVRYVFIRSKHHIQTQQRLLIKIETVRTL